MNWPEMSTYLRPKISLRPPATENDTAEVISQEPGIHTVSPESPSAVPI